MNNPLRDFYDMLIILSTDVEHFNKADSEDQFSRRMYVRAVFAQIEGAVYRMKQICFSKELGLYSDFSASELALLREESYELDDKGRVVIKPGILQLQKNIKFAFEFFSKYFGSDFKLKINDIGWESFLKAIKIRNRLMHPKFVEDLYVSDEEFEITKRANNWFEDSASSALNSASEILETRAKTINKALENINSFIDKLPEQLKSSLDSHKAKDSL